MTREEAKEKAEVMMAYAEGKTIEYCRMGDNMWLPATTPNFAWGSTDYRVKKEPTYRPFKSQEECWEEMQKHQPFGWLQNKENKAYIDTEIIGGSPADCGVDGIEYCEMFNRFSFADGTPFGIKEEE